VAAYQKDVAEFFSDAALESDVSRAVPQHLLVLGCNRADLSDETEQMNGEVWHAALAIVWVALGRFGHERCRRPLRRGWASFCSHATYYRCCQSREFGISVGGDEERHRDASLAGTDSSERRVPESGRSPPAISCWPRRYGWRLWALACCEVGGHRPWRTSARSVW
jgi:hypothetical protein